MTTKVTYDMLADDVKESISEGGGGSNIEFIRSYTTGDYSELVETMATTVGFDHRTSIYRLPIDVEIGDIVWVFAEVEFSNEEAGNATTPIFTRVSMFDDEDATTGRVEICEENGSNVTNERHHETHTRVGYIVSPKAGRKYIILEAYSSGSTYDADGIVVEQDLGRMNVMHIRPKPETGEYIAPAVTFDGTGSYLSRGKVPDSLANGKQGTVSFWIRMNGGDGSAQMILSNHDGSVSGFTVRRDGSNKIRILGFDGSNTKRLDLSSQSSITTASGWVHVVASWDVESGVGYVYVNDADDTDAGNKTLSNGNINYTYNGDMFIGAAPGGGILLDADIADLWFGDFYVDLTNTTRRRQFIDASGKPASFKHGGLVTTAVSDSGTGRAPIIFLSGGASEFNLNVGKGGKLYGFRVALQCGDQP